MNHAQKLESVKRSLEGHPKALRWVNHLEKHFPETLDSALKTETTVGLLISQALELELEMEKMEEGMEEGLGAEQAQMEADNLMAETMP